MAHNFRGFSAHLAVSFALKPVAKWEYYGNRVWKRNATTSWHPGGIKRESERDSYSNYAGIHARVNH